MNSRILKSIKKFKLDLTGFTVCTEAASGIYQYTAIISALAGAKKVWALAKNSKYASRESVIEATVKTAKAFKIEKKISFISSYNDFDLSSVDILTNTGFNRPINESIVKKLSSNCVIPLMWEPWEYRPYELDLEACQERGIKVYGTNESDPRLQTKKYIGYMVVNFLLSNQRTPINSNVLILGNPMFAKEAVTVIESIGFQFKWLDVYKDQSIILDEFDTIVCLEHQKNTLLIGKENHSFINSEMLNNNHLIIHIAGNVNLKDISIKSIPTKPASFGHMSFTTDFIDDMAMIDLHCAGLSVAEGMKKANSLKLHHTEYKIFMEKNYPALAFDEERFW